MRTEAFAQAILMYFIVPLWICMGVLDWWCHKRSRIAETAGPKESLIHLLMFAEVGIPMVSALLLEINALVIGAMILCFLLHEATALWDVSYAVSRREVSPIEQHVHSYLEVVPLLALVLIAVMHPQALLALFGVGEAEADFSLGLKREPLPLAYVAAVLLAAGLFNLLPYLGELARGLHASGRKRAPV